MTTTHPTLLVPDFSEWQGEVNWQQVIHGGFPAAVIRVYNGTRPDSQYVHNRAQAHANGARALGLYAFLNPGGVGSIIAQAQEFIRLVGYLKPGEWPVVDYEAKGLEPYMLKAWVDYVGAHLHGTAPWMYTGEYLLRTEHLDSIVPAKRTWVAAYGSHEPAEGHELWQYTDHRAIPGVAHPCDCSVFHGTVDQLLSAVGAPTRPPVHPIPRERPFPRGIHPGGSTPSAAPLQRALKRTGWMDSRIAESDHYGPATVQGVAGFNAKHSLNSPGTIRDGAIGPHGWALLMSLAYGNG